jgi:hypothetical protein
LYKVTSVKPAVEIFDEFGMWHATKGSALLSLDEDTGTVRWAEHGDQRFGETTAWDTLSDLCEVLAKVG